MVYFNNYADEQAKRQDSYRNLEAVNQSNQQNQHIASSNELKETVDLLTLTCLSIELSLVPYSKDLSRI